MQQQRQLQVQQQQRGQQQHSSFNVANQGNDTADRNPTINTINNTKTKSMGQKKPSGGGSIVLMHTGIDSSPAGAITKGRPVRVQPGGKNEKEKREEKEGEDDDQYYSFL